MTTCDEALRAFRRAGFEQSVIEEHVIPGLADPSSGWLRGGQIADPTHPCEGHPARAFALLVRVRHVRFVRLEGNQVDEGSCEISDDHTLVMPYRLEQGPPIQVEFRFQIRGDTLALEPTGNVPEASSR